MTNTQEHATWGQLQHSAVQPPETLVAAYTAFHVELLVNGLPRRFRRGQKRLFVE